MAGASPCLSDRELVGFFGENCSEQTRARVNSHIDTCADCRALAFALASTTERSATATTSPDAPLYGPLPVVGDAVGRYVLMNLLGSGGMGTVFAAYDPQLDREVALKFLKGTTGEDASKGRDRMLREARALAQLAHAHIVHVYDVDVTDAGTVYIAMELVDGVTLREWANDSRSLDEVCDVFMQVARGLAAAHDAGFVHRDIKPDNILIGRDRRVRISDFGLAQKQTRLRPRTPGLRPAASPFDAETDAGAAVGTPAYMAPEQRAGDSADALSDQYSFFVSLYELLTRRRPAAPVAPDALDFTVVSGRTAVPRALRAVVARGLAQRPSQRFANMHAVLSALKRQEAPKANSTWRVAGVLVVLVILVGGIGYMTRDQRPARLACGLPPVLAETWSPATKAGWRPLLAPPKVTVRAPETARAHTAIMERRIDEHMSGLREAYRSHCQERAPPPAQRTCLDWRAAQLHGVLVEVKAHPDRTAHLASALEYLSALEDCGSPAYLSGLLVEPRTAEADALRLRVARAAAFGRLTHFDDTPTPDTAPAVSSDPQLAARAILVHALTLRRTDPMRAKVMLRNGALAAEKAGALVVAAKMWTMLTDSPRGDLSGSRPPDEDDAPARAQALIRRLGGDAGLQAELSFVRARVARKWAHDTATTRMLHAASLKHWDSRARPNYARLTRLLGTMSQEAMAAGDFDEARRTVARALALSRRHLGPLHLHTERNLTAGARLALGAGDWTTAAGQFRLLLPMVRLRTGAAATEAVRVSIEAAQSLIHVGGYVEAEALTQELERFTARGEVATALRPDVMQVRGLLALRQGRASDAIAHYTDAARVLDTRALEPGAVEQPGARAEVAVALASAHVVSGDVSKAIALLRPALAILESIRGEARRTVPALVLLGEALALTEKHTDARRAFERGLTAAPSGAITRLDAARARWGLAQLAIASPHERARALGLARQALELVATLPAPYDPLKTEIADWLDAHTAERGDAKTDPAPAGPPARGRCRGIHGEYQLKGWGARVARIAGGQARSLTRCASAAPDAMATQKVWSLSLSWRVMTDGTAVFTELVSPATLKGSDFARCVRRVVDTQWCFPVAPRETAATNILMRVKR